MPSSDRAAPLRGVPGPGELLAGRYRVVEVLGHGGMGAVLGAVDEQLDRDVAIKCLLPALTLSERAYRRFSSEARAMARVEHPNVVGVYDVQVHDGLPLLVIERLRGESLEARLRRGPMPLSEVLAAMLDAGRGVAAAHAEGIVHRDLKPANLFSCRAKDGSRRPLKVLDFGVAKLFEDGEQARLSVTGLPIGTPQYMSPEQIAASPAAPSFDAYALGVVLYQAIGGRLPFAATGLVQLLHQIHHAPVEPLGSLAPHAPRQLEALVHRAMERDPRRRATVTELIAELETIASALPAPDARPARQDIAFAPTLDPRGVTLGASTAEASSGEAPGAASGAAAPPRPFGPDAAPAPHPDASAPPHPGASAPPPAVASAPPRPGASAPPHAFASAPPHAFASAPPHAFASAPPHPFASAPPHACASAPGPSLAATPHAPSARPHADGSASAPSLAVSHRPALLGAASARSGRRLLFLGLATFALGALGAATLVGALLAKRLGPSRPAAGPGIEVATEPALTPQQASADERRPSAPSSSAPSSSAPSSTGPSSTAPVVDLRASGACAPRFDGPLDVYMNHATGYFVISTQRLPIHGITFRPGSAGWQRPIVLRPLGDEDRASLHLGLLEQGQTFGLARLSTRAEAPIGGTLRVQRYDPQRGVLHMQLEDVVLLAIDGTACRLDGRIVTHGFTAPAVGAVARP